MESAEQVVPLRHYGRYLAATITLVALVTFGVALALNKNVQASVVGTYLFNATILQGVVSTIVIAVAAQLIGIVLGVVLAVMRQSPNPVLSGVSWLYIWFFRGTPLIVQLIFWSNFGLFYQHFVLGVPFTSLSVASVGVNSILTRYVAGIVGLSLNEGAYMAEVVRAGLLSVDEGQTEAALSLGMTRGLLLRRVVLPQAVRVIIPPTGNEFISMLKNTALLEVIGAGELFTRASDIYSRTFEVIPLLIVASLWYLAMTSVLNFGQYYLERRFARGAMRALPLTPLQRLRMLAAANRNVTDAGASG
ncbi:MAG TPA: amino acid ABC transporter permease [Mycobacteriales bacterium]|nr:amino acid ABC transporter permease [Mycobacteriales bacterium]